MPSSSRDLSGSVRTHSHVAIDLIEHTFTLTLSGDPTPHIDALFEAGCDDATFGAVDGAWFGDFDRVAHSLAEALSGAIAAVESTGLRVLRVGPDDLVTATQIADRLGRSRESVRLLIAGRRGPGNFPAPVMHLDRRSRLWRWSDVLAVFGDVGDAQRADAAVIAMTNAALSMRQNRHAVPAGARVRGLYSLDSAGAVHLEDAAIASDGA
ncbi:MAG: hypothetical protein QOG94_317 [Solirubrobacteraceae bacterium]|nr:hypothetical protein [Solirubrobacteraceae bacterium]